MFEIDEMASVWSENKLDFCGFVSGKKKEKEKIVLW